jgi:dihydrofolate synthase/folylpolyglutamate synthase
MTAGRDAEAMLRTLAAVSAVKPGLERTRSLLAAIGDPQLAFPAIHIAGTNGKGSVAAMLSAVLRQHGLRVGTYTSPHLAHLRERVRVDGRCIEDAAFERLLHALRPIVAAMRDAPSWFEVMTAVALAHFAREEIDLAVVEAGMGGRFDATNVLRSCLSIITNVAMDHREYLGHTVEEIAWEKAGIAKDGVPLVLGRGVVDGAREVVIAECAGRGAPVCRSRVLLDRSGCDWSGTGFRVSSSPFAGEIRLPLVGTYQQENLHTALAALEALRTIGHPVSPADVIVGLGEVTWPGRGEVVAEHPWILLDCAHNAAGAQALVETVDELEPRRERRQLLTGVLQDKDVAALVGAFAPAFSRFVATASASERALSADALRTRLAAAGVEAESSDTVARGLELAQRGLSPDDVLVISGSVTVVGEARRVLRGEPCDE